MKSNCTIVLAMSLAMAGCAKQSEPAPAPSQPPAKVQSSTPSPTPATPTPPATPPPPPPGQDTAVAVAPAPTNEDEPLAGKGRPLTEEEKTLLNYGIYMFKEEKGRFPIDLNEAVKSRYIARMPQLPAGEMLNYDPKSGLVTVIKKK